MGNTMGNKDAMPPDDEQSPSVSKELVVSIVETWQDAISALASAPGTLASSTTAAIKLARSAPGFLMKVSTGDEAAQDELADFCVSCATTCFVLYVAATAINLATIIIFQIKDYFASFLVPPEYETELTEDEVKLEGKDLRTWQHQQIFERIRHAKVNYVLSLPGEDRPVTIATLSSNTAAVLSTCMLVGSAPSALCFMRGPHWCAAHNKATQDLMWTLAAFLGVTYVVQKTK